jgi:hypothetical protein
MHGELAWSIDGEHWDMLPTHPAFLERGPKGSWDGGMVLSADSPVVVGDEMRFYYGGFPLSHETQEENVGAIGLMTAERERLVGVRPRSTEPGIVMTRPFLHGGRRLFVNATINGRLLAEVRTDGNKIVAGWSFDDCDPIRESGFAREVTWKHRRMSEVPEREIRVVWRLENAQLFTFDLVPQDSVPGDG